MTGQTEGSSSSVYCSDSSIIKVGLTSSGTDLKAKIYATNTSHSDCDSLFPYESTEGDSFKITMAQLLNVNDGGDINASPVADAKSVGVVYFTGSQTNITDSISCKNAVQNMYTSNSASRTVTGSALLTKRLAKITSLAPTDYLEVGSAGWLVNGTDNFDTYLGVQSLTMAGDTVDIDAVAEVEALNFNVVVPTTLPIYVASDGTITTATNATVENKSNAAVRITDIVISEKLESGWKLIDDKPSDLRDAKEFTFTTSLAINQVLDRGATVPFTYSTELSPMTSGSDNLDLATVSLTVDRAD